MKGDLKAELDALYERASNSDRYDVTYGPFAGGDPRDFVPDDECCSPEQIAAWRAECAHWSLGEPTNADPDCLPMGNAIVHFAGFGPGTQLWDLTG